MRLLLARAWTALALLMAAAPAFATAPVPIVMGTSNDGALQALQKKVDHLLGFHVVDVRQDFIGAHAGDPDPFFWLNNGVHALSVTLIDRKSPHGVVGWYQDTGAAPAIDGVDDGVVLEDWRLRGSRTQFRVPASVTRFGFYVKHAGGSDDAEDDGRDYLYFTNRTLNDAGLHGHGAEHAPYGGDQQMLVYDVSRWLGPDTWLVACEYSDSGGPVGNGPGQTDNDYSDILFTVTGVGATPTQATSFARVKALYR